MPLAVAVVVMASVPGGVETSAAEALLVAGAEAGDEEDEGTERKEDEGHGEGEASGAAGAMASEDRGAFCVHKTHKCKKKS